MLYLIKEEVRFFFTDGVCKSFTDLELATGVA
jgi:hypothetical protein